VAVLGVLAALLTGCAPAGTVTGHGPVKVTAAFYPLQFLATRIGGPHVTVTDLTKPGTEPHDLELTPRQAVQLSGADVIVYLKGMQPAVDTAVAQAGVKHTVDAASLVRLEAHGTEVDGVHHTTGDNGTDSTDEDDAAADPHIWLDPIRFAQVARGVEKALVADDPRDAADYRRNADTLVRQLHTLDTQFVQGLKHRRTDTFITTHAAFGYFAERYGLVEEAISGIDPDSEPSVSRMRHLSTLARSHHVTTVFFETLASDKTARTMAGDLHLRTDVLDPLEGITPKSRGHDYFSVQRSNLRALRRALGAS
jgi:zinc transport system substrate-binding protein